MKKPNCLKWCFLFFSECIAAARNLAFISPAFAWRLMFAWGLGGCAWLPDHTQDYLLVEERNSVVLPADVTQLELNERLVVPIAPQPEALPNPFVVPRPQPLKIVAQDQNIIEQPSKSSAMPETRLLTDGNGSPILRIDTTFAQAWILVGDALQRQDLKIVDIDRSIGTYYLALHDAPAKTSDDTGRGFEKQEEGSAIYELKVNRVRSGVYLALHQNEATLAVNEYARKFLEMLVQALTETQR